jgi:hypothetical protein
VKIFAHRRQNKREQKEVEGVQGPAEEASQESVALIAIERFEEPDRFHGLVVVAAVVSGNSKFASDVLGFFVRYLVKAKVKSGTTEPLRKAIETETLGRGSIAGDEYLDNMQHARVNEEGIATWVETCFCDPPLEEERPYWEEYFDLLSVKDAHSRRNCRHENGTEPWACCDCDCTTKLEEKLRGRGSSFLAQLRLRTADSCS